MAKLHAIILAAGQSERMGSNKLLLPLGGSTVIGQFLERFPFSCFKQTTLIFSDARVQKICTKHPVLACENRRPELGQSFSIRLGLAQSTEADGIMFLVADQPLLRAESIRALATSFGTSRGSLLIPSVHGKPCNPVVFPASCFKDLESLTGDCGGREVIKKHPELVRHIEFSDPLEFMDIDTMDAYKKVLSLWC